MNSSSNPLLTAWEETLCRRRDEAAVCGPGRQVLRTFAAIRDEAAIFAEHLGDFPPGSVIAIQIGNHPAWPALLLACWRKGLVPLPMEPGITEREREVAAQTCHAAAIITGDVVVATCEAAPVPWTGETPALLKLTSGTTAAPRAIRFGSAQLLADCVQICDTMGITNRDLNFAVIPVSHSYGFSNLLTPLLWRGVALVLSGDRLPRAVLHDLAQSRATVFPGMPLFYQAFGGMTNVPALPDLRLCISAGAPLPLHVALQFREKFGHGIHSFYGSSECGGICYDRDAPLLEEGFIGAPMMGVNLEPLDPLAPISRFRVQSAATGDAYFPNPDEEKLGGGFFVPDDLLAPAENGAGFRIVGRASDLINVAGKKVNPAEVEAALLSFGGVREAVVFGRGSTLRNEEVAACVVAESLVREGDLLEFCRERISSWQVPKRIFFLDALPLTERGKISRRALAARFAS